MTATAVDPLQRAVASALLAAPGGEPPTVLEYLVATGFATRLVAAQRGRGVLQLATWMERTCTRYGTIPRIAALLRRACGIAARELHGLGLDEPSLASDLQTLEGTVLAQLDAAVTAVDALAPAAHLDEKLDEVIASFLIRLDDTDPFTAEHSRAVSLWCRRIARRMSLSEERAAFVARGGLLHDVGKTTTPKEILLAPRTLTPDEYAIIQDHASSGAALIAQIDELRPFIPMVENHHERLDGKGYPNRLPAADISLDVRIVTVADCFNAMIGRRPYRQPLSPAVALDQLVKHRGTQFDPRVVDAMIDVIEHPD